MVVLVVVEGLVVAVGSQTGPLLGLGHRLGAGHTGKDQALQALQQAVGAWDEFKLPADEFFEDGDTVVVLGHTEVKTGGRSAKTPVVNIWRLAGRSDLGFAPRSASSLA